EVLEDQQQRLDLALAQQQPRERLEGPPPALRGIEAGPAEIIHRHVEEGEQRGESGLKGRVQGPYLAGELLADLPRIVPRLDLSVALQQLDHREVAVAPAVRDGRGLEHQPVAGPGRAGQLPDEARLS